MIHHDRIGITLFGVGLTLLIMGLGEAPRRMAAAQTTESGRSDKSERSARRQLRGPLTQEREARALRFVKEHQPALMELLIYLKENRKREYEKALRELDRTVARLEQTRRRQQKRYRIELEAWKAQSMIQLLVARLVMSDDPQTREELTEAIRHQYDLRIRLLELEQQRLKERLRRVETTVTTLKTKRDQQIERSVGQLLRKAERMQQAGTKPPKARGARSKKRQRQPDIDDRGLKEE